MNKTKPKVVTLCGSTRFKDKFFEVAKELTCEGYIVLAPFHFRHCGDIITPKLSELLYSLHIKKIEISDEIYVINVNGYIGESTEKEIEYAKATSKKIRYLEKR